MHHPHRAWAVCAGGAIMLFTVMGLACNVFPIYQPYILAYNHFANAQGSWIITIRSLFIMLGMFSADRACERIGLRRCAALSAGLVALSCFLFGAARTFPVYCLAAAITGIGYSWGGMIPLSLLINRWFQDRQAFVLGLASAGSGVSMIVAAAPLTWLIQHGGLTTAFWAEGAFILLMALLIYLLVRDGPEALGLSPYRSGGDAAPPAPEQPEPAGIARRHWSVLFLAAFLIGGPTSIAFSHMSVLYTSEGYGPGTVAALVSCGGLCLIAGKLLYGELVDRLGGRRSNYLIYGITLLALFLLCLAPLRREALAFAASAAFGFAMPISNMSLSVWAKDLGGGARYSWGLKWIQGIYSLGILLLGPVPGLLADRLGSYVPAYALFFLMTLVSSLLTFWVYRKTRAGERPASRL